ncbi:restriction endonuclease [Desulfosporosinus sp. Sb-LF]|uniref:restriction endonuclease n=1 Tax=Desulfosporosinus sp. Sb-LF TaxID=2560027 RepID=UPI00107F8CC9|nr:restriction endonuclease [Desulfosporosinus sp. Sb-LF]TGE33339.1 restriction endonuclease [Desulfosporosinus sp. Sb-LF]
MSDKTIKLKPYSIKLTSSEIWLLGLGLPFFIYGTKTHTLWGVLTEAFIPGGIYARKAYRLHRIRRQGIQHTDSMDGGSFEIWLEILFKDLGHKTTRTPLTGDKGADLILETQKGKTVIQAKKKASGVVDKKAIKEVLNAKIHYKANAAAAITNQHFGPSAKRLAAEHGVELWERHNLVEFLYSARQKRFPYSLRKYLPTVIWIKT